MIREEIRLNKYTKPTAGVMGEYLQVNVAIIPQSYADEFELFCNQNKKACPLIERSDADLMLSDSTIEIKRDIPMYQHFREGTKVKESFDLLDECLEDYVAFTLGCSFTFEKALIDAGISLRHVEEKCNVSMYSTNIELVPYDIFAGKMVVSMRPIKKDLVAEACVVTSHYPDTHGSPIQVGYPEMIGIDDIQKPDYGDAVSIEEDEIPLFWPCGVTPENVLKDVKLPFAITHTPGHMFVCDKKDSEYYI